MSDGLLMPVFFSLRNSLSYVDIKSTNPKEFKVFLCIRECVLYSLAVVGWRDALQLFSSPSLSRFARFDEWNDQCQKWEAGSPSQTPSTPEHCPFLQSPCHSFKSKVLSPVLPSCHTSFNYLTELQRQEREWVSNRCHFSSSPGGYEGCSKWLRVVFVGMSWEKTILRLLSAHPPRPHQQYFKLRDSKSMLSLSVLQKMELNVS